MGPGFYILAILGCGEGEAECRTVAVAESQYSSQAECNAATDAALMRHVDADYPVVVAQCRRADGPAAAKLWSDEVELPQAEDSRPRVQHAGLKRKS